MKKNKGEAKFTLRLRLDWDENFCVCVLFGFFFFFSRVFKLFECCGYCSCTVQWTVVANFDFLNFFGPISAHRVLCMDPQISLFSNCFITNGSHGTIYTFKNYSLQCFSIFSFNFQFSTVSKRILTHIFIPLLHVMSYHHF